MTIEELSLHWQYFLTIDNDFNATSRYVNHDTGNLDVYSIEFSRLLILTCSEFEMMCRLIHKHYVPRFSLSTEINILNLSKRVISECPSLRNIEVYTVLKERISPLNEWCIIQSNGKYKLNLPWWTGYNGVKHNRHEDFKKANLRNTINAISGLYALFVYMAFVLRDEGDGKHPVIALRESQSVTCNYKSQPLIAAPNEVPHGFEHRT